MTTKLNTYAYMTAVNAVCSNAVECDHNGLEDLTADLIAALITLQEASDVPDGAEAVDTQGMH